MPENPLLALLAASATVLLWVPAVPASHGQIHRGTPAPASAASVRLAGEVEWMVRPVDGDRRDRQERALPERAGSLVSLHRPPAVAQLPVVIAQPAPAQVTTPAVPLAPPPPAASPAPPAPAATASASPAPAAAPDPVESLAAGDAVPAPPQWLQQRADEALALISYPWEHLGYEIHFHSARAGTRAQTLRVEQRIEVFARPSDSARRTAYDLAHEIAHVFDFTYGTDAFHDRWLRARGLEGREWFGCNACPDLATPAGDFAESFAYWQVPGIEFASRLGPPPDGAQRALVAEMTALGT